VTNGVIFYALGMKSEPGSAIHWNNTKAAVLESFPVQSFFFVNRPQYETQSIIVI
jgi:hypothetical protein